MSKGAAARVCLPLAVAKPTVQVAVAVSLLVTGAGEAFLNEGNYYGVMTGGDGC